MLSSRVLKRVFDRKIDRAIARKDRRLKILKPQDATIEHPIIASLTSFPARIGTAHISIEGLLDQTVAPDRVILWLAEEQFPGREEDLPATITDLMARGLEVRFCEDIRSHKKYYYAVKENPNAMVITFDDDLYYPRGIIENLLELYKKYPDCVIATRTHKMTFEGSKPKLYSQWLHNYNKEEPSLYLMHTSGAGTLFPPNLPLDHTFFDKGLIIELSPKSDDVWMKINFLRLKIKVVTNDCFNKDPITVKSAFSTSLVQTNSFDGGKDSQLKKVIDHFKITFNDQ